MAADRVVLTEKKFVVKSENNSIILIEQILCLIEGSFRNFKIIKKLRPDFHPVPQLSFFVKIPATAVTAFYFKQCVEALPAAFGAVR